MKTRTRINLANCNKLLFILALIVLQFSCKKENDENDFGLPKATNTGENTIGCLIDGEPWQTDGIDFGHLIYPIYDEDGSTYLGKNGFNLHAQYAYGFGPETIVESFDIHLNPLLVTKVYHINNIESFQVKFKERVPNELETFIEYHLDTLSNSFVEITTLDMTSNICSGRFEFRLIQEGNVDTLTITEGRFDVNYYE